MKKLFVYILLLILVPVGVAAQKVYSIVVDGTINPATADYIQKGIRKAEQDKVQCLILNLNTPGGLLKSTRMIVGNIMDAKVPVVVYVSPNGAHAGSAGVFITLSAHVAAMAPGTNIGAAHPVSGQGAMDTVMNEKVTNDAAAFIRTIAEKRGRNVEWAEEAVRKSVSLTAREAVEQKVVDLIARNEKDLLKILDGRTVESNDQKFTLSTQNAVLVPIEMSWIEKLLTALSDPNLAYILMMIGFYGILFELYNPGSILPGIIGVISLILAFYALQTLPVNYAGVALIVFGIILYILEIKVVSHGLLAIGGTLSVLLGSLMLIREEPAFEFQRLSLSVIIPVVGVTAVFFLFVVGMGLRAQKRKPVTGMEAMKGYIGETMDDLNPIGSIRVRGEIWKAESTSASIPKGIKVKVVGSQNMKLFVEPINEPT